MILFLPFAVVTFFSLVRYFAFSGGFYLIFWVLGRERFAKSRIMSKWPSRDDIRREMLHSIKTAAVFGMMASLAELGAYFGVIKLYRSVEDHGLPYFISSIVFMIITHDAYFYWTHRVMHHPKLFKSFHGVHHLSRNPTPFASYAFNWREAAIHAVYVPLILLVVPLHPFAIALWLLWMMLFNALGHLGHEIFPRGYTKIFLTNTVTHHQLHHQKINFNFGLYFPWWDMLMGTEYPDYHEEFDGHWSERLAAASRTASAQNPMDDPET